MHAGCGFLPRRISKMEDILDVGLDGQTRGIRLKAAFWTRVKVRPFGPDIDSCSGSFRLWLHSGLRQQGMACGQAVFWHG